MVSIVLMLVRGLAKVAAVLTAFFTVAFFLIATSMAGCKSATLAVLIGGLVGFAAVYGISLLEQPVNRWLERHTHRYAHDDFPTDIRTFTNSVPKPARFKHEQHWG